MNGIELVTRFMVRDHTNLRPSAVAVYREHCSCKIR
jgi:hypothetical protein